MAQLADPAELRRQQSRRHQPRRGHRLHDMFSLLPVRPASVRDHRHHQRRRRDSRRGVSEATGRNDGWESFIELVDLHYPRGSTYATTGDSLFPVPNLDHLESPRVVSGSTVRANVALDRRTPVDVTVSSPATSRRWSELPRHSFSPPASSMASSPSEPSRSSARSNRSRSTRRMPAERSTRRFR